MHYHDETKNIVRLLHTRLPHAIVLTENQGEGFARPGYTRNCTKYSTVRAKFLHFSVYVCMVFKDIHVRARAPLGIMSCRHNDIVLR